MTRLVIYLVVSLLIALAAAWLIALPGRVAIDIGAYRLEPGLGLALAVIIALMALSILLWAIIRRIYEAPGRLARHSARKRYDAGVMALSDGMIALQAGQYSRARTLARDARGKLPDDSAAQLLEARAELAMGDLASAREHYRGLIANPRTALAALSGLYEQARTQNRPNAALTFARKAIAIAPDLGWASDAVFGELAAKGQWADALEMATALPARTKAQKAAKKRRQGVLETALAGALEVTEPETALAYALAALKSIPDFPPAALIAARIHINRAEPRRATSLLAKVWRKTHHDDVAMLYAHVVPGSSALERLKRVRHLVEADANSNVAGAKALARAAIDAHEWSLARNALAPHASARPTQAICALMAEIEEGQNGDQGKSRQWLARAIAAPRDPAWTADGIVAPQWEPISPVTGQLDAFVYKVPLSGETTPMITASPDGEDTGPQPMTLAPASGGEDTAQAQKPTPALSGRDADNKYRQAAIAPLAHPRQRQ